MTIKVMIKNEYYNDGYGDISEHCKWLKNKNIVALHLIENFLGIPMDSDKRLAEIKNIILDVSGELNRMPYNIHLKDDSSERL